jgi:hypothetical protein
MAYSGGRRAQTVSQFIANLNSLDDPEMPIDQESFSFEDDLALFTNAEFFDFDLGQNVDAQPIEYDPVSEERARRENASSHKQSLSFLKGEL